MTPTRAAAQYRAATATSVKPPVARRPRMPDYGVPRGRRGMLPWADVRERLSRARTYWLATTADGAPHAVPVWGVWLEETFYFSSGARSRKVRDLAGDPRCVVGCEADDGAVVVEGVGRRLTDAAILRRMADIYGEKYGWPVEVTGNGVADAHGNEGPVFMVSPRVVMAWRRYPLDATRFDFAPDG